MSPRIRLILIPLAFIAAFFVALLVFESLRVGLLCTPEALADEYHFGSESMVAHGGDNYRSAAAYFASGLAQLPLYLGVLLGLIQFLYNTRPARAAKLPYAWLAPPVTLSVAGLVLLLLGVVGLVDPNNLEAIGRPIPPAPPWPSWVAITLGGMAMGGAQLLRRNLTGASIGAG